VQRELVRAFSLFWGDPTAAGNALRGCVECILTRRGIPRNTVSKGKRRRLQLHDRIVQFEKKSPRQAGALMAVKWIGNEGSHAGSLQLTDVFDAMDVIKDVIDNFWGDREKTLARLINEINRERGPRSRRRRRRRKGTPGDQSRLPRAEEHLRSHEKRRVQLAAGPSPESHRVLS
jgi:hypothetical protein